MTGFSCASLLLLLLDVVVIFDIVPFSHLTNRWLHTRRGSGGSLRVVLLPVGIDCVRIVGEVLLVK